MLKQWWFWLFVLALSLYGLYQYQAQQRPSSYDFKTALLNPDTGAISSISIQLANQAEGLTFRRITDGWIVSQEHTHLRANPATMTNLLQALTALQSYAIATQNPKAWEANGVNQEQAIRIDLRYSDKSSEQLWLGKTVAATDTTPPTGYLRLANQREVFAIANPPFSAIHPELSHYRNDNMVALPADWVITALCDVHKDTTYCFRASPDGWLQPNGQIADPAIFSPYLRQLRYLKGREFITDFDEISAADYWERSLYLYLNQHQDSIIVHCYRDSSLAQPFILHSLQFPHNWATSDSNGLYRQLFKVLDRLVAE